MSESFDNVNMVWTQLRANKFANKLKICEKQKCNVYN